MKIMQKVMPITDLAAFSVSVLAISVVIFGFISNPISVHGESESFTVAARDYVDYQVFMNEGDQINFAIIVQGGTDDDIYFTLYSPTGSRLLDGVVYEEFTDNFLAENSGTYTFRFDNTGSAISNKAVGFSHELKINTYYVYVEPLPSWAIYSGNVVYDSTKAWMDANPHLNFYQVDSPENANLRIQWVKEFGVEHVGYAYGSHFIEVGLGDSNCNEVWQPYSSNHVNWIMTHEIGHVLGLEHDSDPSSIMYPIAPDAQYGIIEEHVTLTDSYVKFVPFCNSKQIADYGFSVSSDDPTYGFDVYVVPSANEFHNAVEGKSFKHYSSSDCFGEGYLEYSGICRGVSQKSGLLVVMDNRQTNSLTQLTIQHQEYATSVSNIQPTTSTVVSYDYPEVYEKDDPTSEDVFSQFEKEQETVTNRGDPILPTKSYPSIDETDNETYGNNTECSRGETLVNGYCISDQLAELIGKEDDDTTCGQGTVLVDGECVIQSSSKPKEIPASFVDTTKDPKSYIQRYVTEESYKKWFEENYPEYSFDEALGISKELYDYLVKEVKASNSEPQEEPSVVKTPEESIVEKTQQVKQCGSGTHLENGVCVLDKQETSQEKQEKDGFTKFLDMIISWFS